LFDVCLLFVWCAPLLFARSCRVRAFLNFVARGRGTPKIASPLRRNMCAQIHVNFDRYIPSQRGPSAKRY
jgi:hypothetical protein